MATVMPERSQGFILYPKQEFPQPVPLASIPPAAGALPSWEQKKLELEMASTNLNSGQQEEEDMNDEPRDGVQDLHVRPVTPPAQKQPELQKESSLRRSGSAFFSSLRSPSSRSNANGNSNSNGNTSYRSASYSGSNHARHSTGNASQIHYDESGGIGTSPRASPRSRSSTIMLYFKRHFGIQNHPEYSNSSSPRSSSVRSPNISSQKIKSKPNKLRRSSTQKGVSSASHSTSQGTSSNGNTSRKTRSSGFTDKMRLASGKVTGRIQTTWRRFNSKSTKEELPKTWEEWRAAYARGQMDLSDMPTHYPERAPGSEEETPYESQYLPAPMPEDHRRRQLAYNRLDLEGKRGGVKPSEIVVAPGEEQLPDTLEGHPAFRDIVSRARETFDSAIAILTVFNENRQLFLAETGLGGMKEVPREVTFCSHAVLQQPPEPFILNDTHEDWRFAKSPLVKQYGCRAYYGVPLLAPDFSGSSDDPVPIGTLCIIDDKPRPNFTIEQRQKMNDLALLAQKTIANWSRARFRARLDAMERSFQLWKNEASALADGPASMSLYQTTRAMQPQRLENGSAGEPLTQQNGQQNGSAEPELYIANQPPPKQIQASPEKATRDSRAAAEASAPASERSEALSPGLYNTAPAPVSLSNKQKIYDISTRLVGDSLELTLVYILRLNLNPSPEMRGEFESQQAPEQDAEAAVRSISLVSSFGLPSPEPAFDSVLHIKALRSEEGGLLYQNPRADEMRAGERLPTTDEVEYASALLVPVCESETSGYVLAGFTDDPERVFERSDLEYMTTIASELAVYLME